MKISELIAKLQGIKDKSGDLEASLATGDIGLTLIKDPIKTAIVGGVVMRFEDKDIRLLLAPEKDVAALIKLCKYWSEQTNNIVYKEVILATFD